MTRIYWTDQKLIETVKHTLEVEQGLKIEEIPSVLSKAYLINIGLKLQLGKFNDSPAKLIQFVYPNTFTNEQLKVRNYSKNNIWQKISKNIKKEDINNKDIILEIFNKANTLKLQNNIHLLNIINDLLSDNISSNIINKIDDILESNIYEQKQKEEINTNTEIHNDTNIDTNINTNIDTNINNIDSDNKKNKEKETIIKEKNKELVENKIKKNNNNKIANIDEIINLVNQEKIPKKFILKNIEQEDRKFYKLSNFEWYDRIEKNYKKDFIWIKTRNRMIVQKIQIKKINKLNHNINMVINCNSILENSNIILSLNLEYDKTEKVWLSSYKDVKFIDTTKDNKYYNKELKNKIYSLSNPLSLHEDFEKIIINALERVKIYNNQKIIQVRKYIF